MLYRKHRPQTFEEIVGQEHVVKSLRGALESGRIGHAYLFTGSRGTGKTTLARVFAKALNCQNYAKLSADFASAAGGKQLSKNIPCNKCVSCQAINNGTSLALIEIDAASQTGVDNIREITDSASISAIGGPRKIFLIDEAHMLSKPAFNALLKTLEEPPAHVVFILATTEVHKIIPTVLSRVQRFDFRRLTQDQIVSKLARVAEQEEIKIDQDALLAIAMSSDGALRDAEVALSKVQACVRKSDRITAKELSEILGIVPFKYYSELTAAVLNNDRAAALELIRRVYESGADMESFSGNLVEYLRQVFLSKINPALLASYRGQARDGEDILTAIGKNTTEHQLIKMMTTFSKARSDAKHSPIPQLPLELAIIDLTS